jgi:hypothetical protein
MAVKKKLVREADDRNLERWQAQRDTALDL